jgi:hypothetical protein
MTHVIGAGAVKPPATISAESVWGEYLTETKHLDGPLYSEVEPWAWARLRSRLSYIRRRDKKANERRPST